MKKLTLKKISFSKAKTINMKKKIMIIILLLLCLFSAFWVVFVRVSEWFDSNRFQFNKPIEITLKAPVEIVERKATVTEIIEIVNELPTLENLTPIEEHICEKWGVFDCRIALAVAKSESGMREQAFNINTNNTIDVGIFQINSVHFKKDNCQFKDMLDERKNVDCAFEIWEAQGWTPWVVFNTGAFKDNL